MSVRAQAWMLEKPKAPLVACEQTLGDAGDGDAIVAVTACGLCHTDLAFAEGSVAPRHPLPLVLGHEIVGTVVEAGSAFSGQLGESVLVPSVIPCGECSFCRNGRGNACPNQKMPGNDIDGGFSTHVRVPAASLVSLRGAPQGTELDALAVVADAVSTAYQAIRRSRLPSEGVVFVVGAGGVGGYLAQIAKALGARVVACEVQPERARALGVDHVCDVRERSPKEIKRELHDLARGWRIPSHAWRIFECSGTVSGQELAYALLAQAAVLGIVGYTREPTTVRLSNLMAFDATAFGSWGCSLDAYPEVLELIYSKKVQLEPFIERGPMSRVNEWLTALSEHRLEKRMVLDPRA